MRRSLKCGRSAIAKIPAIICNGIIECCGINKINPAGIAKKIFIDAKLCSDANNMNRIRPGHGDQTGCIALDDQFWNYISEHAVKMYDIWCCSDLSSTITKIP